MKKLIIILFTVSAFTVFAQEAEKVKPAPEIKEGEGPYTQLIIRGVMMIDGTGAPPVGPVDIVVKQNRIVDIQNAGYPKVPMPLSVEPGARELNAKGMYLMPGFIDCHA